MVILSISTEPLLPGQRPFKAKEVLYIARRRTIIGLPLEL